MGRGCKGASPKAIEVWGLPVSKVDAPGTVNLHEQHTQMPLKICEAGVEKTKVFQKILTNYDRVWQNYDLMNLMEPFLLIVFATISISNK